MVAVMLEMGKDDSILRRSFRYDHVCFNWQIYASRTNINEYNNNNFDIQGNNEEWHF